MWHVLTAELIHTIDRGTEPVIGLELIGNRIVFACMQGEFKQFDMHHAGDLWYPTRQNVPSLSRSANRRRPFCMLLK